MDSIFEGQTCISQAQEEEYDYRQTRSLFLTGYL
jgi:hypothetical protein